MCVPSTVMTGMSVLGSALGMANNLANQKAQAEQQKIQQKQAFQNAKLAEENARKALVEGEKEKEKIRLEQKALQSKKAAAYGAAHVDLTSGSPLAVLTDMAGQAEELAQDSGEKTKSPKLPAAGTAVLSADRPCGKKSFFRGKYGFFGLGFHVLKLWQKIRIQTRTQLFLAGAEHNDRCKHTQ